MRSTKPLEKRRVKWLTIVLAACAGACSGEVGAPSLAGSGASGEAMGPGESAGVGVGSGAIPGLGQSSEALRCDETPIDPGPSPLRMLSREQYLNTLRDLFGEAGTVSALVDSFETPSAFGLLSADVSLVQLEDFQRAAESVATAVVSDEAKLSALVPCDGAEPRSCASDFVREAGSRMYRAPITDDADVERHMALYDLGSSQGHAHGIELLLRGMLQSPHFLYQVELGTDEAVAENAVRLSDYELAARLSYVFWKTLPDEQLTQAARDGALHTPEQVRAQLTRMLDAPKGQPALREFLEGFMHLGQLSDLVKSSEIYPEWQDRGLRDGMLHQARAFLTQVLDDEGGSLEALLTSTTLPMRRDLSPLYGAMANQTDFTPVDHDDGYTSGLLSLPAFLAIQAKPDASSPIYRGKFVREALLCAQLPGPPPNIPEPPEVEPGLSTRDRMQQHQDDPACSGCHRMLDPVGFGFERFDGIGRFRSEDGGRAVDSSGELFGTLDSDGAFDGVVELGARLASSKQVRDCMTRQWFRFAIGRFEQDDDACSVARLSERFADDDASLHALPRAIVESDAFLYRRPIRQESP